MNSTFMRRAIELARQGMRAGDGGPFGAVVVREEEIIGEGWNRVLRDNDPTAHGEISAIRDACSKVGDFSLEGCVIHTTGEPCPMCLGAIHWARIGKVYYGFSIHDAEDAGFDDQDFFGEFSKPPSERLIPAEALLPDEARMLLAEYRALPDKRHY